MPPSPQFFFRRTYAVPPPPSLKLVLASILPSPCLLPSLSHPCLPVSRPPPLPPPLILYPRPVQTHRTHRTRIRLHPPLALHIIKLRRENKDASRVFYNPFLMPVSQVLNAMNVNNGDALRVLGIMVLVHLDVNKLYRLFRSCSSFSSLAPPLHLISSATSSCSAVATCGRPSERPS